MSHRDSHNSDSGGSDEIDLDETLEMKWAKVMAAAPTQRKARPLPLTRLDKELRMAKSLEQRLRKKMANHPVVVAQTKKLPTLRLKKKRATTSASE